MTLKRMTTWVPGYNHRDQGGGIGSMVLKMVLIGDKGAVQFMMMTGWFPPETIEQIKEESLQPDATLEIITRPIAMDLGYHSPKPMFNGHKSMSEPCEYINGKCYYDGSGLAADKLMHEFFVEGEEHVWGRLQDYYNELFEEEKDNA